MTELTLIKPGKEGRRLGKYGLKRDNKDTKRNLETKSRFLPYLNYYVAP